jgi:hypothetical protein
VSIDDTQIIPWLKCIAMEQYIARMDKDITDGTPVGNWPAARKRLVEQINDLHGKPYRSEPQQSAMDPGTFQLRVTR